MKTTALAALVTLAAMTTASQADVKLISQSGYWAAFGGRASDNMTRLWGVRTGFPALGRIFMVKWQPGHDIFIQLYKEGWTVPLNMPVDVQIQFDRAVPWIGKALGKGGAGIELTVPGDHLEEFLKELRFASSMAVTFPTGSEPAWIANMTGSNAASLAMMKCYQGFNPPPAVTSQPYVGSPTILPARPVEQPYIVQPPHASPSPQQPAGLPQGHYEAISLGA